MFIFVLFLMLFTAICFILGAHLEKGCYSVREETLYSEVCCLDFLHAPAPTPDLVSSTENQEFLVRVRR